MLGPHRLEKLKTGDPRRAGAVQNDLHVFDLFARNAQRVQQSRGTDHCRAVLVIMKDGDIHLFFQALFDDETLRRLDILKVYPAERRAHQLDRIDERFGVFGIQFNIDRIHVGEAFEQHRFAFHHRL